MLSAAFSSLPKVTWDHGATQYLEVLAVQWTSLVVRPRFGLSLQQLGLASLCKKELQHPSCPIARLPSRPQQGLDNAGHSLNSRVKRLWRHLILRQAVALNRWSALWYWLFASGDYGGRPGSWLRCGLLHCGCLKPHEMTPPLTACMSEKELLEQRT